MTDLGTQLEAAEAKVAHLRSILADMQQKLAVEEERVALLRRLMELDSPTSGNANDSVAISSPKRRTIVQSTATSLEDAVVSILAESNESVHIGDIHAELKKRGVRIPGKGVDANIIARIIKDPRIEREAGRRGYYRLGAA
jgi:hypothetical protein